MLEAIQANSLPVALIQKHAAPGSIIGPGEVILTAMLTDLAQFFNIGNSFTGQQSGQTIELILIDPLSKNLKPEDFRVIFNNAKKGVYGKVYNRLDGQIVFEWIRAYIAERMAFCEENSIRLAEHYKKADNLIHPEVAAMYKEILKGLEKDIPVASPFADLEEKPKPVKSARDQFIQDCFMEFYKLWEKTPYKGKIQILTPEDKERGIQVRQDPGAKFIDYNGKPVDEVEYVTEKVKAWDKANL